MECQPAIFHLEFVHFGAGHLEPQPRDPAVAAAAVDYNVAGFGGGVVVVVVVVVVAAAAAAAAVAAADEKECLQLQRAYF